MDQDKKNEESRENKGSQTQLSEVDIAVWKKDELWVVDKEMNLIIESI